ncbi:site-specific DNA-methyltransferase [Brachyspira aalborgi]|uniref:Methyltransferase n=1 Tax=Brachyspira aalborgi TaxID=29522 RepID=A0A5C8G3P0_9SPIR|nr:site-specific DNA-methyltransferase [Brachyspira aalborgi]TXJ52267.1 site-specific DNA-methyltransferase [Brachyspira aalborgi]TXJ56148.1 site-specific DNA-methyltransferase [Brachyspira aalborgi]
MTNHKIYFGDSRALNKIEDKSVQLIITSPPYWQLKDYGSNNQIGFNNSYEEYINNLNLVWMECERILSEGCRLCINIGDQFARSVYYGRYKVVPIRTEIIRFCETLKMDYMGAIIWQKATTMNTSGGGAIMGSFPYPRNGILKIDYEFILIFKKLGNPPKPTLEQKENSIMTKEEWNQYFSSHWNFSGVKQSEHIAMFPEELPKRLIKMFSFFGETIFDPFLGSGTTTLAAKNLGRNSIGYEINKEFESIIKEKLNINQLSLDEDTIEFLEDKENNNYSFDKLPYIFEDAHKLDKKIDIKKNKFGSKIDNSKEKREDLFSVKEVISPNKILLNNGMEIKLLGIKEKDNFKPQAINYLKEKFNKRKIFLKYDLQKYDKNNNLMCYVYLDNKTFINNHLIRTGFVDVETNFDYSCKEKFIKSLPL